MNSKRLLLQSTASGQNLYKVPLNVFLKSNKVKATNGDFAFPHLDFIHGRVEKTLKQHLYLHVRKIIYQKHKWVENFEPAPDNIMVSK